MPTWSHSRIESFRQCPRKYYFAYIGKPELPDEPETIAQFVGSRSHDTLEWLYGEVMQGKVPAESQLTATLARVWDAEWHDAVMMPDERSPGEHRELAERWLLDYHRRHAPFATPRTMALERRIVFPLAPDGSQQMQGFVDRIARTEDGTWQVHDYKTNRRLPTQAEKDRDPQLAYYEIGVRALWPDAGRVELVWHFLAFDTAITSRRTPEQLDAVRADALATIADIQPRGRREDRFPTNESALCGFCEFQSVCPVRRHSIAVAALAPSRYAKEKGVTLVNRWAELDGRRKELKAQADAIEGEIEEVRDAIEAYAEKHGLEVVAGDEREATVRRSEKVVFPRKSYADEAEESAALEAQLRASPHWGEASEVSRSALERLWAKRGALAADLRALLEEFAHIEENVAVRLRDRRDA
jgi:putative RecB family exonuclease